MNQTFVILLIASCWIASFAIFGWFSHWQTGLALNAHHHSARKLVPRIDPEELGEVGPLRVSSNESTMRRPMTVTSGNAAKNRTLLPSSVNAALSHDELALRAKIFVNMAAYRDNRCHHTIWQAITRATNPNRLTFGVYQQHDTAKDVDCLAFNKLCQLLDLPGDKLPAVNDYGASKQQIGLVCSLIDNISIKRIDFMNAQGPTVGRFMAQEFMRDEDFYLQIDTHTLFVGGWDIEQIVTWQLAGDPNAVLTTYPLEASLMPVWQAQSPPARKRDALGRHTIERVNVVKDISAYPYDPNVVYFPPTVPVVCSGKFLGDDMGRMPKFDAHHYLRNKKRPILAPYFAAGFAFAPARAIRICRYDKHTPMLFDGEEYSYAARLYTHGFNLYAPPTDTIYHIYETGANPKYWQVDWNVRYFIQRKSARRIAALLTGTPPPAGADVDYDTAEWDRFGLGKNRTMADYLAYSGADLRQYQFTPRCGDIESDRWPSAEWRRDNIQRAP